MLQWSSQSNKDNISLCGYHCNNGWPIGAVGNEVKQLPCILVINTAAAAAAAASSSSPSSSSSSSASASSSFSSSPSSSSSSSSAADAAFMNTGMLLTMVS